MLAHVVINDEERGKRMVTKAKPAEPEAEKPEEPSVEETATLSDEDLTERIRGVLKELLPNFPKADDAPEGEPVTDDGKPVTARQEEARAHSLVAELVAEFKKEFSPDDKEKPEKETETQPGPKAGGLKRWVEKNLWGIE